MSAQPAPTSLEQPVQLSTVLAGAAVGCGLAVAPAAPTAAITPTAAAAAAKELGLSSPQTCFNPARGTGVVLVLVDGLGWLQLLERKGHAATLRSWLAESPSQYGYTCLPSTTAAALTTLGTGALPGATGMVGYSVRHPATQPGNLGPNLCLISWQDTQLKPEAWQDVPTIFERLQPDGQHQRDTRGQSAPLAVSVGPARFAGSGLTLAALRGAKHVAANRLEDRAEFAAAALRRGTGLVYLYVGELDHAGHAHGWQSQQWLGELERLDAMLAQLRRRVPAGTRIVLTADHGMIDTQVSRQINLATDPTLSADVVQVAGEPRLSHLYLRNPDPDLAAQVAARYREHLGPKAAWVGTRSQAQALLGPLSPRAAGVVGDVVVAMAEDWVLVDPRFHSQVAMDLPGVHGSVTDAERQIPLLVVHA